MSRVRKDNEDTMKLELELKRKVGIQQEPKNSVSFVILKIYHEKEEETARINIGLTCILTSWSQREQEVFVKK